MDFSAHTTFGMIAQTLVPVIVAAIFAKVKTLKNWQKLPYIPRQLIIGVVFGILACLSTQFGIQTTSVVLNVRDASPLIAGIVFGGPAGIIAGTIGAIYRVAYVYLFHSGSYSIFACSVSTFIAGFVGAWCRKFHFSKKRVGWIYGFIIGADMEVMHMIILIVSKSSDFEKVYAIVKACAVPMIIASGIAVMLAMMISLLITDKKEAFAVSHKMSQTFTTPLLICVIISFLITSVFNFLVQDSIATYEAQKQLQENVEDVCSDIDTTADDCLLSAAKSIASEIRDEKIQSKVTVHSGEKTRNKYRKELKEVAKKHNVSSISVVSNTGIILVSTNKYYDHYDINSDVRGSQHAFMSLAKGLYKVKVLSYSSSDIDPDTAQKFAGVTLDAEYNFIIVSYNEEQFIASVNENISSVAENRHVSDSGFIAVLQSDGKTIVSAPENSIKQSDFDGATYDEKKAQNGSMFRMEDANGTEYFCICAPAECYYVIGFIPVTQAMYNRDVSLYITAFMEMLVFAALFVLVYTIVSRKIIDNIHKINHSLDQITAGNLIISVNVHDNDEFSSLSDGINTTVASLKEFINEAETRNEKEMALAKTIQESALPNVFPPFPHRTEFDIYAMMKPAKQVGGDFYDFFFIGKRELAFIVADVSGKGVPAAMFMMTTKTMIKSMAEAGMNLDELMNKTNEKLCNMNEAGMFVTAWIGIMNFDTGVLRFVNAGHNPPLLKRKSGQYEYLKARSGLVLAGMEGIKYRVNETKMMPGDMLFLYTDGITEATNVNKELFGEARLQNYLNDAKETDVEKLCKGVLAQVKKFEGEADQFDDETMIAFRMKEIICYNELIIEPSVENTERVSQFVEKWILRTKCPQRLVRKVNIIIDEIYSNIARYSSSEWVSIKYNRDIENVFIVFRDNGMPYNPLEKEDPDITLSAEDREIGGLGIMMVKKIAKNVEYSYEDGCNILKLTISADV